MTLQIILELNKICTGTKKSSILQFSKTLLRSHYPFKDSLKVVIKFNIEVILFSMFKN